VPEFKWKKNHTWSYALWVIGLCWIPLGSWVNMTNDIGEECKGGPGYWATIAFSLELSRACNLQNSRQYILHDGSLLFFRHHSSNKSQIVSQNPPSCWQEALGWWDVQDDEKDKDPTKKWATLVHKCAWRRCRSAFMLSRPELLLRKEKDAQNRGKQSGSNSQNC